MLNYEKIVKQINAEERVMYHEGDIMFLMKEIRCRDKRIDELEDLTVDDQLEEK